MSIFILKYFILDSDQIPIKNQIILIKIFAVLVWISVAFSFINVNMGFVFKRKHYS